MHLLHLTKNLLHKPFQQKYEKKVVKLSFLDIEGQTFFIPLTKMK